jgi:phosphoglycolate phosphatase-like HAD superfamily hydrolase
MKTDQSMPPAVRMIASRFELVIFDCDEVLVDSEPIINRAHADVLTACGYPITEHDLVERFCGMSDAEMLAIVECEWGRALPPSYTERVGVMIENGFVNHSRRLRRSLRRSRRSDCPSA